MLAAARGHGRRGRDARALVRGVRDADRAVGAQKRSASAWTRATCSPPATTCARAESLAEVIDEFDTVVGLRPAGALHINDSMTPLGSNRDRHVNLGDGEIGVEGMIAFLSEPRFEGLPVIFEGPGRAARDRPVDMAWAYDLRSRGLADVSAGVKLPGNSQRRCDLGRMIEDHDRGLDHDLPAPDQPSASAWACCSEASARRCSSRAAAPSGDGPCDDDGDGRHDDDDRPATRARSPRRPPAPIPATAPTGRTC